MRQVQRVPHEPWDWDWQWFTGQLLCGYSWLERALGKVVVVVVRFKLEIDADFRVGIVVDISSGRRDKQSWSVEE